ncbi:hypothetical protein BaRGS_00023668 [Batillaria attramentaria]|uniref:Cysteine and tyrosine-rich protein 1 n=1 Tax=Batillaria attramentaria TaxID=370345 RepID=A0ABD0KDC6_9CAEN
MAASGTASVALLASCFGLALAENCRLSKFNAVGSDYEYKYCSSGCCHTDCCIDVSDHAKVLAGWIIGVIVFICVLVVGIIALTVYCCVRKTQYRGHVMHTQQPGIAYVTPATGYTTTAGWQQPQGPYAPPPYAGAPGYPQAQGGKPDVTPDVTPS